MERGVTYICKKCGNLIWVDDEESYGYLEKICPECRERENEKEMCMV